MDYNATHLMEIQMIIDEADPYLIEAMLGKTEEELLDEIGKLYRELERIPETNEGSRKRHMGIIRTVEALYQSKIINRGEPRGGLIIG